MRTRKIMAAMVSGFLLLSSVVRSAELEPISPEMARSLAEQLCAGAAKNDSLKFKIDPDLDKANGFHLPRKVGVLIVPPKDLKESEELAAKFKTDPGASLAYLFVYQLSPVLNGKPADQSKIPSVTLTFNEGAEHKVQLLLLAVRQLADDDYRLHVYGTDAKPLVDVKFAEGTGPGATPVAIEAKDVDETTKEGKLVVTVFGKYQASFPAAYVGS